MYEFQTGTELLIYAEYLHNDWKKYDFHDFIKFVNAIRQLRNLENKSNTKYKHSNCTISYKFHTFCSINKYELLYDSYNTCLLF